MAMHVVVCLLQSGHTVGVIDLDSRQRTLSRYLENRQRYCRDREIDLPTPEWIALDQSGLDNIKMKEQMEQSLLGGYLNQFNGQVDFIAIDSPGSYTYLSRVAHALADTLLTPMNDSFVDLDLIGQVDPDSLVVESLSHYAQVVNESREHRQQSRRAPIDWVVARNRLATLASKNNKRVHTALMALQEKVQFRYVPGLFERVIYRELFPKGLTMMDLDKVEDMGRMKMSHVTARNEVRALVDALKLPEAPLDLL